MRLIDWLRAAPDRTAAEWLAAAVLDWPRLRLPERHDEPVPARLEALGARLFAGEPLQYILGHTSFRGHTIKCDSRALIPRPETEALVQRVLPRACGTGADVGTGTGCVGLSLLLESADPDLRLILVDQSRDALDLAEENAALLGIDRVGFRRADLLAGQPESSLDFVVANLPYIPTGDWARLEPVVRDHEPRLALDGGPAGLDLVETLVDQASRCLRPGGRIDLEIGESQGEAVAALLAAHGFRHIDIALDAAGRTRFASGTRACFDSIQDGLATNCGLR